MGQTPSISLPLQEIPTPIMHMTQTCIPTNPIIFFKLYVHDVSARSFVIHLPDDYLAPDFVPKPLDRLTPWKKQGNETCIQPHVALRMNVPSKLK
ncbi:hypothetical protein ASPCADRAFT_202675 [Aspergillus carbonarius ITEM 5010]|uniref:Uncharacterized protein n=1 Tax=Aspergillus carbonarius (strain ITEM 5010) TaxID=602072 RepID=A0A1R3S294_ASPC5|nr:hypothetical protein ASPCADRAFT_202675 [Aspergillus carbonarius ITEM 5010]